MSQCASRCPTFFRDLGCDVRVFSSAREFLDSESLLATQCLILDYAMPGMSGLDLQRELKRGGHCIPIIFITAHADKSVRLRMVQHGAISAYSNRSATRTCVNASRRSPAHHEMFLTW